MAIRYQHSNVYSMYFCTFTCFNWLPLFDTASAYHCVYKWFAVLQQQYNCRIVAYVIMPNHLHCILYFSEPGFNLNKVISNGKRFMAYEIIALLKQQGKTTLLQTLTAAVTKREQKKGQLHKVFKDSFDAKAIFSDKFLLQKMNYIHLNPVKGKWQLVNDFTDYEHSSASFYERGIEKHFTPLHYRDI
ncbi:MAG: transposase [Ferruginibacter sp.]